MDGRTNERYRAAGDNHAKLFKLLTEGDGRKVSAIANFNGYHTVKPLRVYSNGTQHQHF